MNRLDGMGAAMAAFLVFAYILCIVHDLVFGNAMYRAWMGLLPGFSWISVPSFCLGLLETIVYGLFFGLVFAPLYNFFLTKVWRYAP